MRLPDFLVIGAAKAGTSSLYYYLNQHPQVFLSPIHEPNFFALAGANLDGQLRGPVDQAAVERYCVRDLKQYTHPLAVFPAFARVGEISPLYLYSDHAPRQISRMIPQVKLIAILRHPADRAFSNYVQYRKAGIEPVPTFEEALAVEDARVKAGWGPWPFWHYWRVGLYAEQLARYYALFPREQIFVGLYDDLRKDPVDLLQRIYAFIRVEACFVPDVSVRHNMSAKPRSDFLHRLATQPNPLKTALKKTLPLALRSKLREEFHRRNAVSQTFDPALREALTTSYRDDILRLQELIGQDLSGWLS